MEQTLHKLEDYMSFDKLTDYLDSLEGAYGMPLGDLLVMKNHEVVYRHKIGFFVQPRTKTRTFKRFS